MCCLRGVINDNRPMQNAVKNELTSFMQLSVGLLYDEAN